jgi:hypothetical protein
MWSLSAAYGRIDDLATNLHGKGTVAGATASPGTSCSCRTGVGHFIHSRCRVPSPAPPVSVNYVLLHLPSGAERSNPSEARSNDAFRLVECFPPSSLAQPYDHTICVFELLPAVSQQFNVLFREGWSGPEEWGRWLDGTSGRALWVAAGPALYRVSIEVFPTAFLVAINGSTLT